MLTSGKAYSNVFHANGGSAAFSVMANTLRGVYDSDVLIAAANSFTGSVLAAQVEDLRQQAAGGWALYRYGSLFGPEAPALAEAECAALRALNK